MLAVCMERIQSTGIDLLSLALCYPIPACYIRITMVYSAAILFESFYNVPRESVCGFLSASWGDVHVFSSSSGR
jgi:hypothetical protein